MWRTRPGNAGTEVPARGRPRNTPVPVRIPARPPRSVLSPPPERPAGRVAARRILPEEVRPTPLPPWLFPSRSLQAPSPLPGPWPRPGPATSRLPACGRWAGEPRHAGPKRLYGSPGRSVGKRNRLPGVPSRAPDRRDRGICRGSPNMNRRTNGNFQVTRRARGHADANEVECLSTRSPIPVTAGFRVVK